MNRKVRPRTATNGVRAARQSGDLRLIGAWVPDELHRRFHVYCAAHNRKLSHVVAQALEAFLDIQEGSGL